MSCASPIRSPSPSPSSLIYQKCQWLMKEKQLFNLMIKLSVVSHTPLSPLSLPSTARRSQPHSYMGSLSGTLLGSCLIATESPPFRNSCWKSQIETRHSICKTAKPDISNQRSKRAQDKTKNNTMNDDKLPSHVQS